MIPVKSSLIIQILLIVFGGAPRIYAALIRRGIEVMRWLVGGTQQRGGFKDIAQENNDER